MDALARLQAYVLAPSEDGSCRGSNYLASAWARLAKLGARDRGIPDREGATTFSFTGTTDRRCSPVCRRTSARATRVSRSVRTSCSACRRTCHGVTLWPKRPAGPWLWRSGTWWGEDWRICESVQQGMSSRVFRFGYYAPMEDLSLDIRRYVGERLASRPDSRPP
jgi:Rieske 2Fe-2S family protein